jgi:hypothetical protein
MSADKVSNKYATFTGESDITRAIRGIYTFKILNAAIELDLFSLLEPKPLTAIDIKKQLNLHGRGLEDFLDTLLSLDLIQREGEGKDALYFNTDECSIFLVKESPNYIGWWLPQKMVEMEGYWSKLPEALRTGKPQREDLKDKQLFDSNYSSEEKSKIFVQGMNLAGLGSFNDYAKKFDFSKYKTCCDVGGANGFLSIQVAKQNPHLNLMTFDLPALESIAQEKIAEEGLADRIAVKRGDFFKDDLPKADIITMGLIMHDWNLEEKKMLIEKAYDALPEGGAFVVFESFIDDARRKHTRGLLMSLHMLLVLPGGFDYTYKDLEGWVKEAGFTKTERMYLEGESDAVIAYK